MGPFLKSLHKMVFGVSEASSPQGAEKVNDADTSPKEKDQKPPATPLKDIGNLDDKSFRNHKHRRKNQVHTIKVSAPLVLRRRQQGRLTHLLPSQLTLNHDRPSKGPVENNVQRLPKPPLKKSSPTSPSSPQNNNKHSEILWSILSTLIEKAQTTGSAELTGPYSQLFSLSNIQTPIQIPPVDPKLEKQVKEITRSFKVALSTNSESQISAQYETIDAGIVIRAWVLAILSILQREGEPPSACSKSCNVTNLRCRTHYRKSRRRQLVEALPGVILFSRRLQFCIAHDEYLREVIPGRRGANLKVLEVIESNKPRGAKTKILTTLSDESSQSKPRSLFHGKESWVGLPLRSLLILKMMASNGGNHVKQDRARALIMRH